MKKYLLIGIAAVMALSFQSCKRSIDAIAKDYCENVKSCLENRKDLGAEKVQTKMQELGEAMQKYLQENPDQQQAFAESVQKYAQELKVDSLYQEFMKENMPQQMPQGQPQQAQPQQGPAAEGPKAAEDQQPEVEVTPVEGDAEAPAESK